MSCVRLPVLAAVCPVLAGQIFVKCRKCDEVTSASKSSIRRFVIMEKALVGAFSVIVKTGCGTDGSICGTNKWGTHGGRFTMVSKGEGASMAKQVQI